MRAGQLRHRIVIQSRSGSTWSDFCQVWAAKEQIFLREQFEQANQLMHDSNMIRFRVRYRRDITDKMRVIFDDRAFDIQRLEELDNTRREMGLLCLEVPYSG